VCVCVCGVVQIGSEVSVLAGQSAALHCSLSTVRPVKKMFWVTPDGRRVYKPGGKGRLYEWICCTFVQLFDFYNELL